MKLSVKDFGATGDGITDDYRSLQNAIDVWKRYGGRLHFPRGWYATSETLDLGGDNREVGGTVTCDGVPEETLPIRFDLNSDPTRVESSITMNGSAIVWRGKDKGGPMLRYAGTHLTWDGPALWGDYAGKLESGNRPTAGFEVYYREGLGSGKIDFRQLSGSRLPIVLHANSNTNTDQFDMRRFCLFDCDVGFRSEGAQNVGNRFGFVMAEHVKQAVFSFANLSHTVVEHAVLNHSVARFVHSEESDYMAGLFSCNSLKVDPQSPKTILIDAGDKPHTFGSYTFRDVSGASESLSIRANGACIITLENCRRIFGEKFFDLRGSEAAQCQINVVRSHVPSSLSSRDLVAGDGKNCRVTFTNCYGDKCMPRADEFAVGGQTTVLSDLQLVEK